MRRLAGLLVLCALAAPAASYANDLNVDRWLTRPGVKLVAVEFYATWCKPCMEAVPKWRALHERHRKDGLRLIVVATQDPQGGCVNPGWNPDDVVCDDEGVLSERFGATKLPAAFLWSWQGHLLVDKGHVEDVESKIESWMQKAPRADVSVNAIASNAGVRKADLQGLIRQALTAQDKVTVLASDDERSRLREIQARSLKASYSESSQCEIGQELSANSLLSASITGATRKRLQLNLLSAERGCLLASSVVDWNRGKQQVSVAEAVDELIGNVKMKTQWPWTVTKTANTKPSVADEYAKLAREAARANRQREQFENTWKTVLEFSNTSAIPKARRVEVLKKFLVDFPTGNTHEAEARTLIAKLDEAPRPVVEKRPRKVDLDEETGDEGGEASVGRDRAPSGDRDGDGITDANDACPLEPEDKDGFEDGDGCPDIDNDNDGIPDRVDKCPNDPEDFDGVEDDDGCPDADPAPQLRFTAQVHFKMNSAEIKRESFKALNKVANQMNKRPRVHVRVEGHSDSRGSDRYNKEMTQRRADAVREFLIGRGVGANRITAVGYGEERPIASNDTAQGRARNRRIEFNVTRQ